MVIGKVDVPVGECSFGGVTDYDAVEISLLVVSYDDYAMAVIVFVEGSRYPMPGSGKDYIGFHNITLDSAALTLEVPFELELVEY